MGQFRYFVRYLSTYIMYINSNFNCLIIVSVSLILNKQFHHSVPHIAQNKRCKINISFFVAKKYNNNRSHFNMAEISKKVTTINGAHKGCIKFN